MDKQTKYLLMVVGATIVVLWLTKPKGNMISTAKESLDNGSIDLSSKTSSPNEADGNLANEQHSGMVGIEAMRSAINNGESKSQLDELNRLLVSENNIKIYSLEDGSLCARNRSGVTVAKE